MSRAIAAAASASRWTSIVIWARSSASLRRPSRSGSRRRSGAAGAGPSCGSWAGSRSGGSPRSRRAGPGTRRRRRPREYSRVGEGLEARIGAEMRGGPLPGRADGVETGPGCLPLVLGGQPLARPAGEGVGVVPGDMEDGLRRIERGVAAAGGPQPAARPVPLPVHRRLGAGVLDEGGVFAVGDRQAVDLEGGELDRVAAALVVVGEALVEGRAPISCSPASSATASDAAGARQGVRAGRGDGAARSRRPSAAAAASSRCADARARAASRRRSRLAAVGPRRPLPGPPRRAPPACAHGRRPGRSAARRRAGSAARRGSCAGSRSRRRSGRGRRAGARARRSSAPATAPRSWRCGPGPRREG